MAEEETLFPPSGRVKSKVWKYFGYRKDAEGLLVDDCFPICKKCDRKVSAKKGNTSHMFDHLRNNHPQQFNTIMMSLSNKKTARYRARLHARARYSAKRGQSCDDIEMNCQWSQESAPYSPSSETDCSSVTQEKPKSIHGWVKQAPKNEIIEWENVNSEARDDAEQDNTLSNAISTAVTPVEGLPTSVMLSFTNLHCLLESKQEKMEALQKQVQDLQEDHAKLQCLLESKREKMETLEKQVQDLQEDRTKLYCLLESKQEKVEALEKKKIKSLAKQLQDLQDHRTKLQCLLESKQKAEALGKKEKMESLEKRVQDLQEDRRFLRAQIENLTSALSAYLRDCVQRKLQEK